MRSFAILLVTIFSCCAARQPEGPLLGAARNGDVVAVRQLLARGADPNARAGGNDWPPLMHAIHKAQLGTAAALIDGGADVNRGTANGETPLMMAAGYGYSDFVRLLLARGADPARRDAKGETALDYAIVGTSDIDRFTLFTCQNDTAALLAVSGPPRSSSTRWARLKRCG